MAYKYILPVLFLFGAITGSFAQESMMQDVSYPFLEKLIATAKANYPKVKAYEIKMNMAKIAVSNAKLDWFNVFSFIYLYSPNNTTALYNQNNPNSSGSSLGLLNGFQFGITLSPGALMEKPGLIKVAKEEYAISKLDQEEYSLNLETIVKQRYFAYIEQLTILNWKTKDLGNSESTLKDIRYKFEKGEITFENYNAVVTLYSNSIQSKIQSEGSLLIAKSNLEEIIGAKLESIQ